MLFIVLQFCGATASGHGGHIPASTESGMNKWSRAKAKYSTHGAVLHTVDQRRRFTALAYVACVATVLGMISWQKSGILSSSRSNMDKLRDSFHLRQEISSLQGIEYPIHEQENYELQTPFIHDVVAHPDELLLLLRLPENSQVPGKEWLFCGFGNNTYTEVIDVELYKARAAVVKCSYPRAELVWSVQDISLEEDKALVFCRPKLPYREPLKWSLLVYEIWTEKEDVVLFAKGIMRRKRDFPNLSRLACVYDGGLEVAVTHAAQEVFRCLHPPVEVRQQYMNRKVTLKMDALLLPSVVYYEPTVRVGRNMEQVASSKVFDERFAITGDMVYNRNARLTRIVQEGTAVLVPGISFEMKQQLLCSCNLIWNGGKFLREWVMYHSALGVEKFFLYDNNSDDNTKEVVEHLVSMGYNIKLIVWPWLKTQEAGFSHCALSAADECAWMMYTDVDEFVFPAMWVNQSLLEAESSFPGKSALFLGPGGEMPGTLLSETSEETETSTTVDDHDFAPELGIRSWGIREPLSVRNDQKRAGGVLTFQAPLVSLILDMTTTVKGNRKAGQVSIPCRDFGPSGLREHPQEGVTVGYTCRLTALKRHKSIVLLAAVDKSLKNYVHHFSLSLEYQSVTVPVRSAVVNHYKYQAWDEFKTKFKRRVSTYVADWTEMRKLDSKDRAPGLGSTAVKPPDWEKQFCEVQDFALRSYASRVFSAGDGAAMVWQ